MKENYFFASSKYVKASSSKLSKILSLVRGKNYEKSLLSLKLFPQKSGLIILKTLRSAANNAINAGVKKPESLYVLMAWANKGSIVKRFQPRAKGKAYKIEKKFSHVNIILSTK